MNVTENDLELLRNFAGGDRQSLGELALRHERAMLGVAKAMLGGREHLALEAVQETWISVIRGAKGFRGKSTVKTWIWRILIRTCTRLRRREARTPARMGDGVTHSQCEAMDDELLWAVERLPARLRHVVFLCYARDMTHQDVAAVLGIPVGTVKSRLNAALLRLRTGLAQGDDK